MTSSTVNTAFQQFMLHAVRLSPDSVKNARSSRNWLIDQIQALPGRDSAFPLLYNEKHIQFGSFARRTKCRELDDIDLMITLIGGGGWYQLLSDTTCDVYVPDNHRLAPFRDASGAVNSRLVINQFIRSLSSVAQYRKAEMKRDSSAAVLNLTSYPWVYDIVPSFLTAEEGDGRTYYLIPDGAGRWKKTDPRLDRNRATSINQNHGGYVLDVVRLVKFWLKRKRGLSLSSYLTEALVLDYYDTPGNTAGKYMNFNLRDVLSGLAERITYDVKDPKDIDGNINDLSWNDRWKAHVLLQEASDACAAACQLESSSQYDAISAWKGVLGADFGEY
ncbi:hypothetical protein [Deinococcus sp. Marseille-Q6407]|uniref:hypothetical protein n=1 Tax=Deinococcus sp. Marseille-Q6407 TaxID=2969223 RepID=UPI0021BF61C4|nr:hypothetical protein [Deinococcus sp. Marseille-Q6407]